MSFARLIWTNATAKKLRLAFASLAVAIAVVVVVSLGVVTHSLESSDLALLQTGRADFTVAQKGNTELLNSTIDASTAARVRATPGVASLTGVLISTTRLDADNPQFLEIGIDPAELAPFGVTVVAGHAFGTYSGNELMLGWRAAQNLGAKVGDGLRIGTTTYTVVGIYSTGQALGDAGAMLPLVPFQAAQRQPSEYTLLFVRAAPGASVDALQASIDHNFPELTTVRTLAQYGRADRSLSLLLAADRAATILAVVVGATIVVSAMTISFVERLREFGVLAAVGWSPTRIAAMIGGEAAVTGLFGAVGGLVLAVAAVAVVQQLPGLLGVLHPVFTFAVFARALLTAAATVTIGGLVPAVRAALTEPLEALRNE
jgi:putative ABC transport system permease protein